MLDPDLPCIRTLKANLLLFAELGTETDVRKIEWEWSQRVIFVLKKLQTTSQMASKRVLVILTEVVKERGYDYVFGNTYLCLRVTDWVGKEKEREAIIFGKVSSKTPKDYISEQREKMRAAVQARPAPSSDPTLPAAGPSGARASTSSSSEDDEDEDEVVSVPVTAKTPVKFTCTKDGVKLSTLHVPADAQLTVTPIKEYNKSIRGRLDWTDIMKVQLLRTYVLVAEDPSAKKSSEKAKAPFLGNFKADKAGRDPLIMSQGIKVEDDKFKLKDFAAPDTLAQIMSFRGLTGQPKNQGLAWFVHEGVKDIPNATIKQIRANVDEIVALASNLCE